MKYKKLKKVTEMAAVIMIAATLLAGCGQGEESQNTAADGQRAADSSNAGAGAEVAANTETADSNQPVGQAEELEIRFGDEGQPFLMKLEENETAAAIARYVGTSDWRLPIYERDEDADYSVMQYYDISSRYDIPSNPEAVTSQKAGDVYYSDPNRIVLFYHDAQLSGEYTKIGSFDATETFVAAVENNPVLEGWGNKIVQIAQP